MRPLIVLLAGAAALISAAPAAAQLSRQGGPIDITADATEFLSSANVNRWIGRVNVRQGDARLMADAMDVYFTTSADGGTRQIERIEAEGSVAYITPLEIARGDRGIYAATSERITLTGNVTLIRGDTTLAGQQLVIEPRAGRSSLTREGDAAPSADGRVRGVFSSAGDAEGDDGEAASGGED